MSYVLCCGSSGQSLAVRVPGADAVVQARPYPRPEAAQPGRVAADPPLAVDLHDAAELAVGRGVEVVRRGLDGQGDPEVLVAVLVLADRELGLSQGALERRKQVRDRLGVVPDVGAASRGPARCPRRSPPIPTGARRPGAGPWTTSGCSGWRPRPRRPPAAGRSRRSSRRSALRPAPQLRVVVAPVGRELVDAGESPGIPRLVVVGRRSRSGGRRDHVAQPRPRGVPGEPQADGLASLPAGSGTVRTATRPSAACPRSGPAGRRPRPVRRRARPSSADRTSCRGTRRG